MLIGQFFYTEVSKLSFLNILGLITLYLIGFVFRGIRSKILLPSLNYVDAFCGVIIGYAANNVLPARLGEVVRAHLIGKKINVSRSTTLSSILIERVFDGFAIVILLCIGSVNLNLTSFALKCRNFGLVFFSLGLLGVLISGFFNEFFLKFIPSGKIGKFAKGILEGTKIASRSYSAVFFILITSFLVWISESSMFYYGALIFDFNLSFLSSLLILGIVNLGVLIPSSPGNLGLFQYFTVAALSVFPSISHSSATAYAIVIHLFQLLPVTILGFAFLPYYGAKSFSDISK